MELKSKHLVTAALFLVMAWATPALAKCTFTNLSATRDGTGRNITVSPTFTQCDTLPSDLTLDVFNFSSAFYSSQVYYLSGPVNISSSGLTVKPGGLVASAAIHTTRTLHFNTVGDYTFQARGLSGPFTPSPTFVVRISRFTVSPESLYMATGGVAPGANTLYVSTNLSGQIKFSTSYVGNEGGTSRSNVSVNLVSNPMQGVVSVSPQGSSGVFRVDTTTSIFSANSVPVIVSPQTLIQVVVGEAQGQTDKAQRAVAAVVRNRVANPLFPKTYNDVILAPSQFASTTTARFTKAATRATALDTAAYDQAVTLSGGIFARTDSLSVGGAISFGSPGAVFSSAQLNTEIAKINDAINRCPKVSAKTLGFDRRWYPSLGIDDQAIVFNEIDPRVFVFVRQRPKDACAVIRMPLQ
jgi:Cell Wall Hydrolase